MSPLQFIESYSPFVGDLKRLKKKYPSLPEDIEVLKKAAIDLLHCHNIDNHSIEKIPGFCSNELWICKVRKFACKSLKGKGSQTGLRLIYAYSLTKFTVTFIEIYHKNEQTNEDRSRIKSFISSI